jgi:hypothetical protein
VVLAKSISALNSRSRRQYAAGVLNRSLAVAALKSH